MAEIDETFQIETDKNIYIIDGNFQVQCVI